MGSVSPVTLVHLSPMEVLFERLSTLTRLEGAEGKGPNAKISSLLNAEY